MTPVIVVIAVMVGLMMGTMLVGLALFFWKLLRAVSSMERIVGQLSEVFTPLVKSGALIQLARSSANIGSDLTRLLQSISGMHQSLKLFNQAFFKKDALLDEEPAPAGSNGFATEENSSVYEYSEENQAVSEKRQHFEIVGLEEPPPSQMHGVSVS